MESLGSVAMAAATATKAVEVDLQGLQNKALELKAEMQYHLRHELVPDCLSL